jgi:hypothetical protein
MDKKSTQVMNRTIHTTAMECAVSFASDAFMKCIFTNGNGVSTEIDNVSVYHVDVPHPQLDVHRDKRTGQTVIAVQTDGAMACDVMGEPARGVTVRCRG